MSPSSSVRMDWRQTRPAHQDQSYNAARNVLISAPNSGQFPPFMLISRCRFPCHTRLPSHRDIVNISACIQANREVYVVLQPTTVSQRLHRLSGSSAIEIQHRGHLCFVDGMISRRIGAVLSDAAKTKSELVAVRVNLPDLSQTHRVGPRYYTSTWRFPRPGCRACRRGLLPRRRFAQGLVLNAIPSFNDGTHGYETWTLTMILQHTLNASISADNTQDSFFTCLQ